MPKKWDLRIVDSANLLTDKITSYQKNFWFQDNYTLTSYMLNFSINSINSGVYFATERLPVPPSDSNNGIGVIVEEINTFSRIGIHESSSLKSDTLSISVGDNLRFAYNAISHKAYLFNTSTKDTVAITLLQDSDKYYFQSEGKISNSSQGYSYADGGMDDKTSATYGDIYDMSSLADNEAAFLSFVQTLSITSIPEPTSALLSIYALAILAARRRRK